MQRQLTTLFIHVLFFCMAFTSLSLLFGPELSSLLPGGIQKNSFSTTDLWAVRGSALFLFFAVSILWWVFAKTSKEAVVKSLRVIKPSTEQRLARLLLERHDIDTTTSRYRLKVRIKALLNDNSILMSYRLEHGEYPTFELDTLVDEVRKNSISKNAI